MTIVDDDSVIVPAPDTSVFLHKPEYAAAPRMRKRLQVGMGFRRTFIPILLTGGLILFVLGALHFAWNADNNPMLGVPGWLVGVMFGVAMLLWVLAAANMLVVRHMLAEQARVSPASSGRPASR